MSHNTIKYHGVCSEGRVAKIVWIDDKIVFGCVAELNERGHSKGLPTIRIAGPDDQKMMKSIYAFRSFTPEITEAEFIEVANAVSQSIISFTSELPLEKGLSQTNLITG